MSMRRGRGRGSLAGTARGGDQPIGIINDWNSEIEQDSIEFGPALPDDVVQAALPLLLVVPNTEGDPEGEGRPIALVHEGNYAQRERRSSGEITTDRPPQDRTIDPPRRQVS